MAKVGSNTAAVLYGINDLRVHDWELPEKLAAGHVRVQMSNVGICGSDVHYLQHGRWEQQRSSNLQHNGISDSVRDSIQLSQQHGCQQQQRCAAKGAACSSCMKQQGSHGGCDQCRGTCTHIYQFQKTWLQQLFAHILSPGTCRSDCFMRHAHSHVSVATAFAGLVTL
jgi:threonine dehydrogenase-like Zn-dependent dehydrogenase